MPDPSSNLLLVEGKDDQHVVSHICHRIDRVPSFRIIQKEGIASLLESIRVEARTPGLATLGIVADADDNLTNRWQAITDRLRTIGVEAPTVPGSHGTIISGRPRIGIWLMPDNESPGELEDFIEEMIPSNDPVWPLAEAYIDSIPPADRKFTDGKMLRAKVHAWLATREEPRPMGTAIRAGDLDIRVPLSTIFMDWLRQLFN